MPGKPLCSLNQALAFEEIFLQTPLHETPLHQALSVTTRETTSQALEKKLQPQAMQLSSLRSPPQALSWPQTRPPRRGTLEKSPPPFPNGIRPPSQSRHTPRNLIWFTRSPIRSIGRKRRNSSVASTNNLEKIPAQFQLELSMQIPRPAPSVKMLRALVLGLHGTPPLGLVRRATNTIRFPSLHNRLMMIACRGVDHNRCTSSRGGFKALQLQTNSQKEGSAPELVIPIGRLQSAPR